MTPTQPNRRTLLGGLAAALFGWTFGKQAPATAAETALTVEKAPLPLDANLTTFEASGLPPGISLNANSGVLSGIIRFPPGEGTGTIELK